MSNTPIKVEKNLYSIIEIDLDKLFWKIAIIAKVIEKETDVTKIAVIVIQYNLYKEEFEKIKVKCSTFLDPNDTYNTIIDKYLKTWKNDDIINKINRIEIMLNFVKDRI